MGTRPNLFREQGDTDIPRRPWLGVGDGVDPRHVGSDVLPLQDWDRINMGSMMAGLALSGPFSPGGLPDPARGHLHREVTAMGPWASRDGADATLALCSPGRELMPRWLYAHQPCTRMYGTGERDGDRVLGTG